MIARGIGSVLATAALALAPFAGDARAIVAGGCGAAAGLLIVPVEPGSRPDDRAPCAKACHVAADRRTKATGGGKACC